MKKKRNEREMGSKSPNISALVLPLLLILFTLSSQLEVVECTGRKLCKFLYNKYTLCLALSLLCFLVYIIFNEKMERVYGKI